MTGIAGELCIRRPPELLFDVIADERNEPRYNPAMLRIEKLTSGPIGVGTRFEGAHAGRRRPVTMTVEVTGYDRPRRMASTTNMA